MHDTSTPLMPNQGRPAEHRHPGRHLAGMGLLGGVWLVALLWAIVGALWTPALALALVFYGAALALAGWTFASSYPHPRLGMCNIVTLGRLVLTASLIAALVSDIEVWRVLLIAIVAFSADGLDGWLARREGLASDFGARFDMEVDSAFALILAGLAVQSGLSPLVLLLGLPRYAFGIGQMLLPALNNPLPERFSRKVVCVVQIAALIVLIVPWIEPSLRHAVALLIGAVVVWSFALDIRALSKARP